MDYYKGEDFQLELSYTQNKLCIIVWSEYAQYVACLSRSILKVIVDDLQFLQVAILVSQLLY